MPAKPKDPTPPLNWYGLPELGYDNLPMTGNWLTDQLSIEMVCFRIGLRREEGGLGRFGHMKRGVDLLWNNPELESSKRCIWNPWTDRLLREACQCEELGVAGAASSGKSDPAALWAVWSYIADPTHTLVLVMSTTLQGAKKRVWKTVREYWEAVPGLPGKPLWSVNEIQGLNYSGDGYGQSSGIYLLASEQSNEKGVLDRLVGIKSPRTGVSGATFEELVAGPEYADLAKRYDEDYLRDLIPRLQNLSDDRIGRIIMVIDEATGCSPSILNVWRSNLKPGNVGHSQMVMLSNPNSFYDTFGDFCTPADGYANVTINDEEWETKTGGKCIRFNAEKNPRIVDKNEKLSWMLRAEDIQTMKDTYGPNSLYVWRMCYGMWSPKGTESGIYSQADIEMTGSSGDVTWGFEAPAKLCAFDPSFTNGGDKAACAFGLLGRDANGRVVLKLTEETVIKSDISDLRLPVSYQLVRNWKKECERRGVPPENCCFDATGGGVSFGDIVRMQWSPAVMPVSSGGKASTAVLSERGPDGRRLTARERFANKATEIWMGAMPFFRAGQIRGVGAALAKQLCSRQYDKGGQGDSRVLKVEGKRVFKAREGGSPDESDAFLLLVELAKVRHGFRPSEQPAPDTPAAAKTGTWAAFVAKARRITTKRNLLKK